MSEKDTAAGPSKVIMNQGLTVRSTNDPSEIETNDESSEEEEEDEDDLNVQFSKRDGKYDEKTDDQCKNEPKKVTPVKTVPPCLLCGVKRSPHVDRVFQRVEIMDMVKRIMGMPLVPDTSLPSTICCNCIMRMNACLEYQRCIYRNILNHRIKHFYNLGDRVNVVKYQDECKRFQTRCMQLPSGVSESFFADSSLSRLLNSQMDRSTMLPDSIVNNDTAGLIISDVRTEELPQEPDSTGDEIDDSEHALPTTSAELLEPMFQTSESAFDTESGGNIHTQNEAITPRRKQAETLTCQHCGKVYRRTNAWRKHLRTHHAEQRKSIGERPKHKCSDCNQEFESLMVLRKHAIIHDTRFQCKFCNEEFRLMHAYDWHMICCEAKNISIEEDSPRRRTRSQTQTERMARQSGRLSAINSSDNESCGTGRFSSSVDSMYNERIRVVKLWTSQLHKGEKPDPKDLASANVRDDDCVSISSDISSMTRISNASLGANTSASSMSSGRSRQKKDSVAWAHEQKRRRLHKQGKLKAKQHGKEYYACSFRHFCAFGSTSLTKTMYHEVQVHNALLLHQCVECSEWFTNKENLIRHKRHHRPQLHICISCNYKFDNKYELEHHTLLHSEKTFNCQYCEMSFLKRSELERHTNYYHQNDVIHRYGIITRVTAANKSKESPYLQRHRFEGYKSKELIQSSQPEVEDEPIAVVADAADAAAAAAADAAAAAADADALETTQSAEEIDNDIRQLETANDLEVSSSLRGLSKDIDAISTISVNSSCGSNKSLAPNQENRELNAEFRLQSGMSMRDESDADANMMNVDSDENDVEDIESENVDDFIDDDDEIYTISDVSEEGEDGDEYRQQTSYCNSLYHMPSPVEHYSNNDTDIGRDHIMDTDRSVSPNESLDCFDVFSVDNVAEENHSSTSTDHTDVVDELVIDESHSRRNSSNSENSADKQCLELPRRKINRSATLLPVVLVDKYIPPYDVLFEKYLQHSNANSAV